jgi:cytochrome c biogenesis protein CcdA
MFHLLALVLLIGIVDSANPSTVAPALYLAAGDMAIRSLSGFIAGVFLVNLAGGILLALGPGQAILALVPHPGHELRNLIELCLGGGLFVVAAGLWLARRRVARRLTGKHERMHRSSALVGAGIMVVELPTAVPYFAVIAAVVDSGRDVVTQIGLLAAFNAAYIAPLVAILGVRSLARDDAQQVLERLRAGLDRRLAEVIPALVLVAAIALTAVGVAGVLGH